MSQDPSSPAPPPAPPAAPPPPPPPGGGGEGPRLPWEERDRLGVVDALLETLKLLVTAPADAFSRLRPDGDYLWPLAFGLIFSWIGQVISQFWNLLLGSAMQSMMGGFGFGDMAGSFFSSIFMIVFWPILYVIVLFISAGIYHLALMLVGGTERSPMGFEGTYKVMAYAAVANLLNAIPIIGWLAALVAMLILLVVGFIEVHKASQVQAIAGALIPLVVCCLCGMLMMLVFGAGIAAMMAGASG